jgi:hypothetical protein
MDANQRLSQQVIDDFVGVAHGDCVRVKELLSQHPGLVKARASWDELGIEAAVQTGRVEIAMEQRLVRADRMPDKSLT